MAPLAKFACLGTTVPVICRSAYRTGTFLVLPAFNVWLEAMFPLPACQALIPASLAFQHAVHVRKATFARYMELLTLSFAQLGTIVLSDHKLLYLVISGHTAIQLDSTLYHNASYVQRVNIA